MNDQRIKEDQNEYAKDKNGNIVFVRDVESGKKGYWCLGCDEEMQAVKFKVEHYRSYFRHDATDVKIERKCTFSSESARRILAGDILARIKRIKLPNLYKFSPDGKSKILIQEACFIEGTSVSAFLTFYENPDGTVAWGKKPDVEQDYVLATPDVTFFDLGGNPILMIEFDTAKKINDEKRIKLKRLDIDTIQLNIPKDSPENIAKSLAVSQHTKWIYSHVEQHTNYLQLPQRNREGISAADAIEMGFFRETFACRESQINNLIRALTKCVESQYYRGIEQEFIRELSSVGADTERDRERLESLRSEHRGNVEARYRQSFIEIEESERQLDVESGISEKEVATKERELESRYLEKRDDIEARRSEIERLIRESGDIERAEAFVAESREEVEREIDNIDQRIQSIIANRAKIANRFERLTAEEQSRIANERERIERARENHPQDIENRKRALAAEFESIRERAIEAIKNRDSSGDSELSDGIKRILAARGLIASINEAQIAFTRSRKAYDCFMDGSYKNWYFS